MKGSVKISSVFCVILTGTLLLLFQTQNNKGEDSSSDPLYIATTSNHIQTLATLETPENMAEWEQASTVSEQEMKDFKHKNIDNKENLMFIKTHKCGTSTLVNTFYLYGVRHRSNFVFQTIHGTTDAVHQLELDPGYTAR